VDFGQSKNFIVHQILAKHQKYGLENVAGMDIVLRHSGKQFFLLDVMPMKIGNGTGAPCRLIAHLNRGKKTLIKNKKNSFVKLNKN
jgi:kynurenine formamidase